MAERRDCLVKKRGFLKSTLKRLLKFLDTYTDTPLNRAKMDERITTTKELYDNLRDLSAELQALEPEVDHEEEGEQLCEAIIDAIAQAKFIRAQHADDRTSNPGTHATEARAPSATISCASASCSQSKIPQIGLQTFDGSIEKWRAFSDWFVATIHNREGLSDSSKLSYLHASLTGEAAKTIEGFEATDENYTEAWDLLKLTYDNPRVIVFRHYELLCNIPKLQNNNSAAIRQLINAFQVHIRGMKVLGQPVDQWDTPLLHLALSKLDHHTKREWNRTLTGTEVPKFNDLTTFLREESTRLQSSTTRETMQNASKANTKTVTQTTDKHKEKPRQSFSTASHRTCPICSNDGHAVYKCEKFLSLSIADRLTATKKAQICLNCLRPNHKANECRSSNCLKCGKTHNTLLHFNQREDKPQEQES